MIKKYLKYLLTARNEHSLHSPFVFELYTKVIRSKKSSDIFREIESLRSKLLKDRRTIEITDFGAGSKIYKSNTRQIRQIAKSAEKSPKFGKLLFRLISFFQPSVIFDLGTSLGITTIYEAKANPEAKIFSFEGCPETAKIALQNFSDTACNNIEVVVGNLDETLQEKVNQVSRIDFAFFDANHRYEPTMQYFKTCLPKVHNETVFVFDDIHWSEEMHQAWTDIKNDSSVLISIDLFFVGLVFFRTNQPKQDFVLRF